MKKEVVLSTILIISLLITACSVNQPIDDSESNKVPESVAAESKTRSETENLSEKTGIFSEQILNGNDGEIHYSYYLPEDYDESKDLSLDDDYAGLRYDVVWRRFFGQ